MEIAVGGWRAAEPEVAGSLLPEQLPRLTDEQRSVAKKLGIPEEEYARGVVAGEQNRASILRSEDAREVLQQAA